MSDNNTMIEDFDFVCPAHPDRTEIPAHHQRGSESDGVGALGAKVFDLEAKVLNLEEQLNSLTDEVENDLKVHIEMLEGNSFEEKTEGRFETLEARLQDRIGTLFDAAEARLTEAKEPQTLPDGSLAYGEDLDNGEGSAEGSADGDATDLGEESDQADDDEEVDEADNGGGDDRRSNSGESGLRLQQIEERLEFLEDSDYADAESRLDSLEPRLSNFGIQVDRLETTLERLGTKLDHFRETSPSVIENLDQYRQKPPPAKRPPYFDAQKTKRKAKEFNNLARSLNRKHVSAVEPITALHDTRNNPIPEFPVDEWAILDMDDASLYTVLSCLGAKAPWTGQPDEKRARLRQMIGLAGS
ncbi:MAG: hypothetical protein M1837_000787 [Sclerophora amabilis]|nr:MAG: hypothetical protein M1837_000787 [Sclerophora amabilis]